MTRKFILLSDSDSPFDIRDGLFFGLWALYPLNPSLRFFFLFWGFARLWLQSSPGFVDAVGMESVDVVGLRQLYLLYFRGQIEEGPRLGGIRSGDDECAEAKFLNGPQ